jgi:hypothetical protein
MPFTYFASGLSLQKNGTPVTGTSVLNFVNGDLSVNGNVADFVAPSIILTQGGQTINNPNQIQLAGSAVLSAVATPPSIVQYVNGSTRDTQTIILPNATIPGNLLVSLASTVEGLPQNMTPGFTLIGQYENIYAYAKLIVTAGDNQVTYSPQGSVAFSLFEIGMWKGGAISSLSTLGGAGNLAGDVLTSSEISALSGALALVMFSADGLNQNWSNFENCEAVFASNSSVYPYGYPHAVTNTVVTFSNANQAVSATYSQAPTNQGFLALIIPANPDNVGAVITT